MAGATERNLGGPAVSEREMGMDEVIPNLMVSLALQK
jgi:hypothetical protein